MCVVCTVASHTVGEYCGCKPLRADGQRHSGTVGTSPFTSARSGKVAHLRLIQNAFCHFVSVLQAAGRAPRRATFVLF